MCVHLAANSMTDAVGKCSRREILPEEFFIPTRAPGREVEVNAGAERNRRLRRPNGGIYFCLPGGYWLPLQKINALH
jgi:hypothetical protein